MNGTTSDFEYGEPDDENPEWTEDSFRWSVRVSDFPDHAASIAFLIRKSEFLREAAALGMSREAFWPFDPTRPGFVERATAALEQLAKSGKHAAE